MRQARCQVIGIADIEAARDRIAAAIRPTPVERSASLSACAGVPVLLKLEHHQASGSFKLRGATNAVLQLDARARAAGVVGVSTGNHGRGLARACAATGTRCVIAMSTLVPENKRAAIRAEGAEIVIKGDSQDAAQIAAERMAAQGMTLIPPFDHPDVIAGQGTLGLEIAQEIGDAQTAIVPLSGGGLISGVAAALKARLPGIRVVGVSMERGAAMAQSLRAGHPVEVRELPTLADSLGGGIGLNNRLTFAMVRDLVDEVVLVTEREIETAIRHCYTEERQIVEGAGAVGVAAILAGKTTPAGPAVVLLSGGNIDMGLHRRIVAGEDAGPQ